MYRLVLIFTIAFGLLSGLKVSAQDMVWHNPDTSAFNVVGGRFWHDEDGEMYQRFPSRAQDLVREPVWSLSRHSAGLNIRFYSNAPVIEVDYALLNKSQMAHMPLTGSSGVDLYACNEKRQKYMCLPYFKFKDRVRYTFPDLSYHDGGEKGYEFILYLPLYDGVTDLKIGVPEGSHFEFILPSAEKPIVVYGTSIAQGGCASRPGMAWTNILERWLDRPVYNFGFSGNGTLDAEVFNLFSEIDASVFVIDCMPNLMNTPEDEIERRLIEGIRILRTKSDAPILLVDNCGYMTYPVNGNRKEMNERSRGMGERMYKKIKKEYKHIYHLTMKEIGLSLDSQVDGVHATDWGMMQYAKAYYKKLKNI